MNIGNNEVPIGIKPPQVDVGQGQVPTGVKPPEVNTINIQNHPCSPTNIDVGSGQSHGGVKPPEVNTGNVQTPICPPSHVDVGCRKIPAGIRPVHWLQLDTTLTKPGYAADAYAVGNLFGKLNAPVFVVEPNKTTLDEIQQAHNNEKLIVIYYENKNYFLSDLDENGAVFTTVYNDNGETYTQNIYVGSDSQWEVSDPISTTSQEDVIDLIQQALSQIDIVNGNVWEQGV